MKDIPMIEWKKFMQPDLHGEVAHKDNRSVELVKFADYDKSNVMYIVWKVYMWEDNKIKNDCNYFDEVSARKMAIEFLETGKDCVNSMKLKSS